MALIASGFPSVTGQVLATLEMWKSKIQIATVLTKDAKKTGGGGCGGGSLFLHSHHQDTAFRLCPHRLRPAPSPPSPCALTALASSRQVRRQPDGGHPDGGGRRDRPVQADQGPPRAAGRLWAGATDTGAAPAPAAAAAVAAAAAAAHAHAHLPCSCRRRRCCSSASSSSLLPLLLPLLMLMLMLILVLASSSSSSPYPRRTARSSVRWRRAAATSRRPWCAIKEMITLVLLPTCHPLSCGAGCSCSFGGAPQAAMRSDIIRRQVESWPAAAIPMENPYCSCTPYGESLLQLYANAGRPHPATAGRAAPGAVAPPGQGAAPAGPHLRKQHGLTLRHDGPVRLGLAVQRAPNHKNGPVHLGGWARRRSSGRSAGCCSTGTRRPGPRTSAR